MSTISLPLNKAEAYTINEKTVRRLNLGYEEYWRKYLHKDNSRSRVEIGKRSLLTFDQYIYHRGLTCLVSAKRPNMGMSILIAMARGMPRT